MAQGGQNVKREHWIDLCRGLAIILVVWGHVVGNGALAGIVPETLQQAASAIAYLYLAPFFFLSGYLVRLDRQKSVPQLWGRFWRKEVGLLVPYAVFTVIFVGVKYVLGDSGAVSNPVPMADALGMLVAPVGLFWFLYALMLFNLFFFLLQLLTKALPERYTPVLLWGSAAVCLLGLMEPPELLTPLSGVCRAMPYGVYFFLGVAVRATVRPLGKRWDLLIALCSAAVAVGCLLLQQALGQTPLLRFAISLAVLAALTHGARCIVCKSLAYVGEHSMPIYLLHAFVLGVVKMVLVRLGVDEPWMFILIATAVAVLVPLGAYVWIVKKVKLFDFFFNTAKYLPKSEVTHHDQRSDPDS